MSQNNRFKLLKRAIILAFFLLLATFIRSNQVVAAQNEVKQVKYVPGYGIRVYQINSQTVDPTESTVAHGSVWQVFDSQTVDGKSYSKVGGNQWVEAQYLTTYIAQVFYIPGYSIRVYRINEGRIRPTDQLLEDGSRWHVNAVQMVNGTKHYDLGNNQWV